MSFFGKIFGKKDDDFGDLGNFDDSSFDKLGGDIPGGDSPFGSETGLTPSEEPTQMPQQPAAPQRPQQRQQFSQPAQPHDEFGGTMQSPYPQHEVQRAQPTVSPSVSGAMQYQPTENSSYVLGKNLEVISYKLDALRAAIDSLSQRVANLERIATQEEPRTRGGW